MVNKGKSVIFKFFFFTLVIGLCFSILYPLLKIIPVVTSDFKYLGNPDVIWVPIKFSLLSFRAAISLGFGNGSGIALTLLYAAAITAVQIFISALAGYSLGRVKFPLSKLAMALVIVTIITPPQALLISQYLRFKSFDIFGLISLINGKPLDLINKPYVLYVLAATGFGVKQSIFVFIFRQFFAGLPMELEEAALIDGCGFYKTFFKIAMPNAAASVVTVASLAFVWNYGDTYYTGYFHPEGPYVANHLLKLFAENNDNISKVLRAIQQRFLLPTQSTFMFDAVKHAAALIYLAPLLILYFAAQKKIVEGFERSGIVG